MQENDKPVLIYSTFPSPEAAEAVGRELVEAAAGRLRQHPARHDVNLSLGRGHRARQRGGDDHQDARNLAGTVIEAVKARHTYTNPALIVLPILGGSADYLRWLGEETAEPDKD